MRSSSAILSVYVEAIMVRSGSFGRTIQENNVSMLRLRWAPLEPQVSVSVRGFTAERGIDLSEKVEVDGNTAVFMEHEGKIGLWNVSCSVCGGVRFEVGADTVQRVGFGYCLSCLGGKNTRKRCYKLFKNYEKIHQVLEI